MKIGFVTPARHVRASHFSDAMQGHETRSLVWSPRRSLDVAWLASRAVVLARWADILVILKPRQPTWALDAIRRTNRNIVLDVDDAIWEWNANSATRFRHALAYSRLVIAGSEHLVREIVAMPSAPEAICVRPAIKVADYEVRRHEDRAPITAGWIGGPSSLADFTLPVIEALRVLVNEGAAVLDIVCDRPLDSDLTSTFVPWSVETEARVVSQFDVGIMPLLDNAAHQGRCGLKVIQYQAAGLPVVAAPIGVGPELVDSSVGFLADSRDDWIARMRELAGNSALRAQLGAAARKRAETEYDIHIAERRIREAISSLA